MAKTTGAHEVPETWWVIVKYWLSIASVVAVLLALVFMMVDGSVMNFQCSFWRFITLECNRWNAVFTPWG